ncbi:MAG TPA: phenylalanine--tRNA ligase subunit beta [Candidatus Udaeobacter sp.]|nr:phenylalanine--tRNA ligase subunit beta [Candidatus Udaeobacter sp.]
MLISYNWLKKYVNLPDSISAAEVAEKLKASTVEVEGIEVQGKNLENIVVGKIITCEKHPNADKLKLCKADVGNEQLQIICGGSNVKDGMLVALAKVGAKVKWHGEGELIELKPTAIRGIESAGMICASTEIGLGGMFPLRDEKEILDLSFIVGKAKQPHGLGSTNKGFVAPHLASHKDKFVGRPLAEALGLDDSILEIDNKSLSNRPDLWGHYGIAREVAVLFNKKLKEFKTGKIKPSKEINLKVEVEDTKLCPRYMAVAVSGVSVEPSPQWLQKALLAVGQRSINNIVDITNYIMLDMGQPMHAFDASKITNSTIVVRKAKDGEEFVTLDGLKRNLDSSMLMIGDKDKNLAIAGIKGGLDSGITDGTKTIIFESANFEAASIRKTSAKLGLRTDSSARFEKSLDPNLAALALERAVELIVECCPQAKVVSKVVDEAKFNLQQGPLAISLDFFHKKIGVKLAKKEIIKILEHLGFEIKTSGDEFKVKIPTWRATKDISIPEDLVEEVVRIYGYEKIAPQLPEFFIDPPEENKLRQLERQCKNILVNSLAYTEVYNYSFVSGAQIAKMTDNPDRYLQLDNPLSKEKPYLRRCLLLNLLENLENNQAGRDRLNLFEIGKVFRGENPGLRVESNKDSLLPGQDTWLTAVCLEKKNNAPFWQAREVVDILAKTVLPGLEVSKSDAGGIGRHPTRSVSLAVGEKIVGSVYELHPQVIENFGLDGRVAVVKINLSMVVDLPAAGEKYSALVEFPIVERDLAISVKKNINHGDIMAALSAVNPLLQSVELFDVYEGKGVGDNYKSMAYHFVYQNRERTLVTEEVDKVHNEIIKILREKFGAEVR